MNKQSLSVILLSFLFSGLLTAQTETEPNDRLPKWKPTSFQLLTGQLIGNSNYASTFNMKDLSADYQVLSNDDYYWIKRYYSSDVNKSLGFYVETQKLNKDKTGYRKNQNFRFGVWYQQLTFARVTGAEIKRTILDTLSSNSSSEIMYKSRLNSDSYDFTRQAGQLSLDAAYIINTGSKIN